MLLCICCIHAYGQQPTDPAKLHADFLSDSLGQQGLRASYLASKRQGDMTMYLFDGVPATHYFSGFSKKDVLAILGEPNRVITKEYLITNETKEREEVIDRIQYFMTSSMNQCTQACSFGLGIPPVPPNKGKQYKGMATAVGFEVYFNCEEKDLPERSEDIMIMEFWFNPKTQKKD